MQRTLWWDTCAERARFPFERVGVTSSSRLLRLCLAFLCTLVVLGSIQPFGFLRLDPKNARRERPFVWFGGVVMFSLIGPGGLRDPSESCVSPSASLADARNPVWVAVLCNFKRKNLSQVVASACLSQCRCHSFHSSSLRSRTVQMEVASIVWNVSSESLGNFTTIQILD